VTLNPKANLDPPRLNPSSIFLYVQLNDLQESKNSANLNLRKISQKNLFLIELCVIFKLISNMFLNRSSAAEISELGNLPNRLSWMNFHYISVVSSDNSLVKYSIH